MIKINSIAHHLQVTLLQMMIILVTFVILYIAIGFIKCIWKLTKKRVAFYNRRIKAIEKQQQRNSCYYRNPYNSAINYTMDKEE